MVREAKHQALSGTANPNLWYSYGMVREAKHQVVQLWHGPRSKAPSGTAMAWSKKLSTKWYSYGMVREAKHQVVQLWHSPRS